MRVDTKEVVRRQLRALGNDRFELGIQHRATGAMELGMLRAVFRVNAGRMGGQLCRMNTRSR